MPGLLIAHIKKDWGINVPLRHMLILELKKNNRGLVIKVMTEVAIARVMSYGARPLAD